MKHIKKLKNIYLKTFVLVTLINIFLSCQSSAPEPVVFESKPRVIPEKAVYKDVDVEDIEDAKTTIETNREKRKKVVKQGMERGKKFEPLFLDLIAYTDYGVELTLDKVLPYRDELAHTSAIFNYEESNAFTHWRTEDDMSLKKLYQEAEKAEENNLAVKQLKKEKAELQKQIDTGYTAMLVKLSSSFLGIGGIMLVVSAFPFVALYAGKIRAIGGLMLATGGSILMIGTFVESVREALEKHGNWLFLLLAVPLILFCVILAGAWTKNKVEDLDEEDNIKE